MTDCSVDVIIPAYRPGDEFARLLASLSAQTLRPRRIIVINTDKAYWKPDWEKSFPLLSVTHISRGDFDHGGTRHLAVQKSTADYFVCMTQDALPEDETLLEKLLAPLEGDTRIAAAYARQVPRPGCGLLEKWQREFNYPARGSVRGAKDEGRWGIKTYFCSNVCAAYRRAAYEAAGGFLKRALLNEDMLLAGALAEKGGLIAYVPEARVLHSHNYSGRRQFHRNFDIGASHVQHADFFSRFPPEGEGKRLVKTLAARCTRSGKAYLLPKLVFQSACKYAGFFLGKHYRSLPRGMVRRCSMYPLFWKEEDWN